MSTNNQHPRHDIASHAPTRLVDCYQCGKCSGGCPMGHHMDLLPHQLIHLLHLGHLERAIACDTIWQCVSCQTCTSRCPQSVDCAGVMDVLRQMAVERGVASRSQKRIWSFHQAFLNNVRRNGRLSELELIGVVKTTAFADDWSIRGLCKDSFLAPRLMRRGKFHLISEKVRDRSVVRRIFQRCQWPASGGGSHE